MEETDYDRARRLGLTNIPRWEAAVPHHPMSVRLMEFLREHDHRDCDDGFDWRMGGDGDNGEMLMFEMDAFFELVEAESDA